ncbi:MAG: response regulator [Deltaproteobacteria bacterium]|nr:response regulator [Deltaproteobacteria bacterium]
MELKNLLVIDDEAPILEMLEMSLASEGYHVLTAESGSHGLQVFKQHRPKLVLTDIKMPEMDGIEVLKRIKTMDRDTEVIVITGHGDMDSAISAIRHGASDFITKPIRDEILMLALERAKEKVRIHQQLRDYTENLEEKIEVCKVELKRAEAELIKNERLASIGETVAGLAHYIKNILTGLRGGMYMVNRGMAGDKPKMLQDGWAMVQRNIEKVSQLVLDLLQYSKDRVPERSMCRPNDIARDAMDLFQEKAGLHGIVLKAFFDEGLEEAYTDQEALYRVLLNLISNAIDACIFDPDTGKAWEVVLRTTLEEQNGQGRLVFEVSDNGTGMTDEVKAKLFSRFFSTKGGQGTGLGLLVTQKIIKELGGEISVDSTEGQGTTFTVRLDLQTPADHAPGVDER